MLARFPRIARQAAIVVAVIVLCLASSSTYSVLNEALASHENECYHDVECPLILCNANGECLPSAAGCGKESESGDYDFTDHDVSCGMKTEFDGVDCTIVSGGCGSGACFRCVTCPH